MDERQCAAWAHFLEEERQRRLWHGRKRIKKLTRRRSIGKSHKLDSVGRWR
jgi:hypothetical protein